MWRARIAVATAAFLAALAPATGGTAAATDPDGLSLTVAAGDPGWISFAASGPQTGSVDVRELLGRRSVRVARLSLRDGTAERKRGAAWRCSPRARRFSATLRGRAAARSAKAQITTPSCADRLRMIVVPARLRPGGVATVRVIDTWRLGGIGARICARPDGNEKHCTAVRIRPGSAKARTTVRLEAPGHRAIALSSASGQRLDARVDVREDARVRLLVTGDSMIVGLFEALAGDLATTGTVIGDPHPGRGITTPGGFLDWPAHARRSARTDHPDVTVVLLGAADAGYPLSSPSGELVPCCDPPWVAEYARRVSSMMAAWMREGRGLVYWVLLPAPRSPTKARVATAENQAVRLAARDFDEGVTVIASVADILTPDDEYHETIEFGGRSQVVRDADGVHLAAPGIRIAADIIGETLRADGLLP